ncbi:hypothetical protein ACFWF7_24530 [Nocardia sp. NPDC060256]|uniref:hypothetical protein n=1 Tax=unclassified Nocardia TaxID=2637762 RepID=UPI003648B4C9
MNVAPWFRIVQTLRQIRPLLLVAALTAIIAFGVASARNLLIRAGGTGGPAGLADVLWQLLLFAALSGVLAFLIVEFIKHQTPLRGGFHRLLVERYFGADINRLNEQVVEQTYRSPVESSRIAAVGSPSYLSYDSTSRQLAGQLAESLSYFAVCVANSPISDELRDALAYAAIGDRRVAQGLIPGHREDPGAEIAADRPRGSSKRRPADAVYEHIERRLDAFQIHVQNRWHRLLRATSAGWAGFFAAIGASVIHLGAAELVLATMGGVAIGGPVAWLIRDLARLVERRGVL